MHFANGMTAMWCDKTSTNNFPILRTYFEWNTNHMIAKDQLVRHTNFSPMSSIEIDCMIIETSSTILHCSSILHSILHIRVESDTNTVWCNTCLMALNWKLKSNHMGILNKTDHFFEHQQLPRSA